MRRRPYLVAALLAGTGVSSVAWAATHRAQHLVISEVAFDTVAEGTAATSEYIEIHNPTNAPIALNAGAVPGTVTANGSYFLSDTASGAVGTEYFRVVNGPVAEGSNVDFVVQFPAGAMIPAHGTVVVCGDSDAFLTEFFGGSLSAFTGQPGKPQLFEYPGATPDGNADGVPDMIDRATGTAIRWNLTNGGETAILFYWDGSSDLVKDVDIATWGKPSAANAAPAKTTAKTIDGPDADSTPSAYHLDATVNPTWTASSTKQFIARRSIVENSEIETGGNGMDGADETSEVTTPPGTATAADGWLWGPIASMTPGTQVYANDGLFVEDTSWGTAAAVSSADGPNGSASPLDYGADGTLTELYVQGIDANRDGVVESLYVGVRGDLFGEPDTNTNAELVLIDINPQTLTAGGVRQALASGSDLSDTTGTVDGLITNAGFKLGSTFDAGANWDAAIVLDQAAASAGFQDLRTWNATAGGAPGNFASLLGGAHLAPTFDGNIDPSLFPAATGTNHAGPDGFEATIPLDKYGVPVTYVGLTAVTTVGDGTNASPNTLPEGSFDSMTGPVVIDRQLCWDVAANHAVTFYDDADHDGFGNGAPSTYCGPAKTGIVANNTDCNDGNAAINPGATEACDGVDNNCDGLVDDADPAVNATTWYADSDGDGFGDASTPQLKCAQPSGYVSDSSDCLDTDPLVRPTATEVCDTKDDDCDGLVDDADPSVADQTTWYKDADKDTYGDPATSTTKCFDPSTSSASWVIDNSDCDDATDTVHPGATETCDLVDNDCNTLIDDADPAVQGRGTYYADNDGDGEGAPAHSAQFCFGALDYASNARDCNDNDASIKSTATETCDSIDNDCDGAVDDADSSVTGQYAWYPDADGDLFGDDIASATLGCLAPSATAVKNDADCDDAVATINPLADEICDGLDNDCDLGIDDADPEGAVGTFWYPDADHDLHGRDNVQGTEVCTAPGLDWSELNDDCDDTVAARFTGNAEICDTIDNDCDNLIDAADPDVVGATRYFPDVDADHFGDVNDAGTLECADPGGATSTDNTDCDDASAVTYPGAPELLDGLDNDCDGHDETYDADGDGFDAYEEAQAGTDPDLADTDGDGVDDGTEVNELGTDPLAADSDTDGLSDGDEVAAGTDPLDPDTDGDALADGDEITAGTNPLDPDSDSDGVSDGAEVQAGTNPLAADTDGDGVPDGLEIRDGTNPIDPSSFHDDAYDGDADGLPDHAEYTLGTDPTKADTDGDGLSDGDEVDTYGTDPLVADTDGDGVDDGTEIARGADPLDASDHGIGPDTGDSDTDTGGITPPDKKCGCATGASTPEWLVGLAMLAVVRRRRGVSGRRPR